MTEQEKKTIEQMIQQVVGKALQERDETLAKEQAEQDRKNAINRIKDQVGNAICDIQIYAWEAEAARWQTNGTRTVVAVYRALKDIENDLEKLQNQIEPVSRENLKP